MIAADRASERIRGGMAPGLAIHICSKEYGVTTRRIAAVLSRRRKARKRKVSEPPQNAWWLN